MGFVWTNLFFGVGRARLSFSGGPPFVSECVSLYPMSVLKRQAMFFFSWVWLAFLFVRGLARATFGEVVERFLNCFIRFSASSTPNVHVYVCKYYMYCKYSQCLQLTDCTLYRHFLCTLTSFLPVVFFPSFSLSTDRHSSVWTIHSMTSVHAHLDRTGLELIVFAETSAVILSSWKSYMYRHFDSQF